jgi:hypothetical protein
MDRTYSLEDLEAQCRCPYTRIPGIDDDSENCVADKRVEERGRRERRGGRREETQVDRTAVATNAADTHTAATTATTVADARMISPWILESSCNSRENTTDLFVM